MIEVGDPLADAARLRQDARDQVEEAKQELVTAILAFAQLEEEIERLRTSEDETELRVLARRATGQRAEVALASVEQVTATQLRQEDDAADAAIAAAELMWRKTRAEERPSEEPLAVSGGEPVPADRPSLSLLRRVALGVLAASMVAGFVIPSLVVVSAGATGVGLLWLVRPRRRSPAIRQAGTGDEDGRAIGAPADGERNPLYREQPSTTVPKYRRDGTVPTQRA